MKTTGLSISSYASVKFTVITNVCSTWHLTYSVSGVTKDAVAKVLSVHSIDFLFITG